jgi:hypothetical protein
MLYCTINVCMSRVSAYPTRSTILYRNCFFKTYSVKSGISSCGRRLLYKTILIFVGRWGNKIFIQLQLNRLRRRCKAWWTNHSSDLLLRRWTWTGDFNFREVKTGFCRKRWTQTGSSGTLIGWKSGQTTFIPLWDRMEGAWLWTLRIFYW